VQDQRLPRCCSSHMASASSSSYCCRAPGSASPLVVYIGCASGLATRCRHRMYFCFASFAIRRPNTSHTKHWFSIARPDQVCLSHFRTPAAIYDRPTRAPGDVRFLFFILACLSCRPTARGSETVAMNCAQELPGAACNGSPAPNTSCELEPPRMTCSSTCYAVCC